MTCLHHPLLAVLEVQLHPRVSLVRHVHIPEASSSSACRASPAMMTTFPIRCLGSLQTLPVTASNYRLQRYLSYTMPLCITITNLP